MYSSAPVDFLICISMPGSPEYTLFETPQNSYVGPLLGGDGDHTSSVPRYVQKLPVVSTSGIETAAKFSVEVVHEYGELQNAATNFRPVTDTVRLVIVVQSMTQQLHFNSPAALRISFPAAVLCFRAMLAVGVVLIAVDEHNPRRPRIATDHAGYLKAGEDVWIAAGR